MTERKGWSVSRGAARCPQPDRVPTRAQRGGHLQGPCLPSRRPGDRRRPDRRPGGPGPIGTVAAHGGGGQVHGAGHHRGAAGGGARLPLEVGGRGTGLRPRARRRRSGRAVAPVAPRRLPLALGLVRRRQPHPRDGRGGPGSRPRVPRPHRSQRAPDRGPRPRRGATPPAADGGRRAEPGARAVPHPDRHGGRHPRGRNSWTSTRTCSASSTSSWPASTPSCGWRRRR